MVIINRLLNSIVFWTAWIIIPVLMEIIPAVGSLFLLAKRHWGKKRSAQQMNIYPEISIIVPVYNSESTLFACIRSIYECDYPNDRMRVFLVNNKGKDDSFSVFAKCQKLFPDLPMQWMNAQQGKSKALNLALYNSEGKYIINLDSDGMLEKSALNNMIEKFEANPDLNCMTGAILIIPEQIEAYPRFFSRLLRKLEFMEYAQAFLAGRSYASEINGIYTLSGAFSAFRKSAVLKSQMYNTDTICEDTQITFQMKYVYKERVEVCENAIYFVDPIESVNKLYTQRQRWQRGSLEVAKMFSGKGLNLFNLFGDINVKTLMYDHTFAFPRMVWYLAMLCLLCMNYSGGSVVFASILIILIYIGIGYFYFFSTQLFLKKTPKIRKYYRSQWWVVMFLPLFNIAVFFIRIAGIINSINTDSAWKTRDITDERKAFTGVLKEDMKKLLALIEKVQRFINKEEKKDEEVVEEIPAEVLNAQVHPEERSVYAVAEKEPESNGTVGFYVTVGIVYFIGALILVVSTWIYQTYGVGLNELLTTFNLNLKGTSSDVVIAAVSSCLPPILGALLAVGVFIFFDRIRCGEKGRRIKKAVRGLVSLGAMVLFFTAVFSVNTYFDVIGYFKTSISQTQIYDEYYVNPDEVAITDNGDSKNLIYIYIESLETTYASTEAGGAQTENYIPNLTRLAEENISFSDKEGLGGFHSTNGTGITMGALFGTTSGVPYSLGTEADRMLGQGNFMSGITSLGDILADKGYTQEFLCGSDGDFGGRKTYFETHGDYKVFDLYSAREAGYIADDYFVWWGYEDAILYEIAKDEVTKIAQSKEPFNFTMLTVDPHHIDGYICDHCKDTYDNVTANVMVCSDTLLNDFIEWCKKQDFYEDTVIIVSGDHPRMDTSLVEGVSYYDRTVYNCFINSANTGSYQLKNRTFTPLDMFPTILSAMGFSIEGERLGLGTNLFSDKPTLAEEKGFDWLDTELSKESKYYYKAFVPELGN